MKKYFILFFCLVSTTLLIGQNEKINIAIIDFFIPPKPKQKELKEITYRGWTIGNQLDYGEMFAKIDKFQNYVTAKFAADNRFSLVERNNLNLIIEERELQKSEEFIDGYIAEQGKAIGADYLVLGDFELNEASLTLTVYSVADGRVTASEIVNLTKGLTTNYRSVIKPINKAVSRLINKFAPNYIKVIEITKEKKSSANQVLVKGGSGRGLKKRDKVEFKILEERTVEDEFISYYKTIGKGKVAIVEDQNFSLIDIKKGGEEIMKYIQSGTKVYCINK